MIRSPAELREMSAAGLAALAEDIRQRIVETCLKNGGHLGASLGPVELAIALHRVFDSPAEPIIWDVGHQAYAHKLLTGRWEEFSTLRQSRGISGFLSRTESPHDVFGAGHSSTSISAALALAWARAQKSETQEQWTVAVIGDGGLTAGMALEALNNVRGLRHAPLLVILNDNQMSIGPNVGAVSSILACGDAQPFFEQFGLDYVGPVDGHQLELLIGVLENIKRSGTDRPVLLHVHTQKGKGYVPAEERPAHYHGIAAIAKSEPAPQGKGQPARTFSQELGSTLCKLAKEDPRVVAITAAMPDGTGLLEFARQYPSRFFDVGIAEQHAVTFAAGLAAAGFRPVVAIYSTFLQRALDQVIHDVCLQSLPVVFAIDRAGLVGADGPTHHGVFDLAFLSALPGLAVEAPSSLSDMRASLNRAIEASGPVAIRYPRGAGEESFEAETVDHGWSSLLGSHGSSVWIVALGRMVAPALAAAKKEGSAGRSVRVIGVTSAKPTPLTLINEIRSAPEKPIVFIEDGVRKGGWAEGVLASLNARQAPARILAMPDRFLPHGSISWLEDLAGVSESSIATVIQEFFKG